MKTNVALYLRVSTEDQTTANQLPDLTSYAERRGWQIVANFLEEGLSGSLESRPALDSLRAEAKAGKFTAVLCWKFDRISRNTRHLLTLHEELSKLGVALVSVTEAIDTSTPAGKFTMTVMGGVAELERANLIERTKAGLVRARAQGKCVGRVLSSAGIARAKAKGVPIAGSQFPFDMARIAALVAAGKNANQIALEIGAPRATVYRKVAALTGVA